jgi:hypothetical protein
MKHISDISRCRAATLLDRNLCYLGDMGRLKRPGTKRLIRLRDTQWDDLARIAKQLSAEGGKSWSVTEVVEMAVDSFLGKRADNPTAGKKTGK